MATTTRRRDVEAFERLLWQWFDAESNVRAIREDNTPDWKAEGTKEAKAAATQALDAVLKAFEAGPDDATLPRYSSSDTSIEAVLWRSLETGHLHPALNGPVGRRVFDLLQRVTGKAPKRSDEVFIEAAVGIKEQYKQATTHEEVKAVDEVLFSALKVFTRDLAAEIAPLPPQNSRDSDFP
jgi:hypothetical protein